MMTMTKNDTKPAFIREAFTCPHCGVYAEQEWWMSEGLENAPTWVEQARVSLTRCRHCGGVAVWRGAAIVDPLPPECPRGQPSVQPAH